MSFGPISENPPKATAETLPDPAGEQDDLASHYDTHDTSTDMEHGHRVDAQPMQTTSLRLPTDLAQINDRLARIEAAITQRPV